MALATKTLDLAGGPVDLIADAEVAAEIAAAAGAIKVLIQNTSRTTAKIHYAEGIAEPDVSDRAHCLNAGDSFVLILADGNPSSAWAWSTASTATLTLTSAGE